MDTCAILGKRQCDDHPHAQRKRRLENRRVLSRDLPGWLRGWDTSNSPGALSHGYYRLVNVYESIISMAKLGR